MNWIDDYCAWASQCTDAPTIYHKWGAYSAMAAAVGRQCLIMTGADPMPCNLYILILGKSSIYRKSTALSLSRSIVRRLENVKVMPDDGSAEGLLKFLNGNPVAIMYHSEFASLLALFNRDYGAALQPILTALYDPTDFYTRQLSGSEFTITKPCLNIMGASTLDWLVDKSKVSNFSGGFLSRFCVVPATHKERTVALPTPVDEAGRNHLVRTLQQYVGFSGKHEHKISVEPIRREYEAWYHDFERQATGPIISAYVARLAMTALKLTVLEGIADGGNMGLTARAFERATAAVQSVVEVIRELEETEIGYGEDREGRDMKTVCRIIREAGEDGIVSRNLMQRTKLSAARIKPILDTLQTTEQVEIRTVKTATKPITLICWTDVQKVRKVNEEG